MKTFQREAPQAHTKTNRTAHVQVKRMRARERAGAHMDILNGKERRREGKVGSTSSRSTHTMVFLYVPFLARSKMPWMSRAEDCGLHWYGKVTTAGKERRKRLWDRGPRKLL